MNYHKKLLFGVLSILFLFSSIRINALDLSINDINYNWQSAQQLQKVLKKEYGNTKPFSQYMNNLYYLVILEKKLSDVKQTSKNDSSVVDAWENVNTLLQTLETVSEKISRYLQHNQESQENPMPEFLKILNTTQNTLKKYEQYLQDEEDDWSPMSLLPPKPPWHDFTVNEWFFWGKVAIGIGLAFSGYFLISSFIQGDLTHKIEKVETNINILRKQITNIEEALRAYQKNKDTMEKISNDLSAITKTANEHVRKLYVAECKKDPGIVDLEQKIEDIISKKEELASFKENLKTLLESINSQLDNFRKLSNSQESPQIPQSPQSPQSSSESQKKSKISKVFRISKKSNKKK